MRVALATPTPAIPPRPMPNAASLSDNLHGVA